MKYLSFDIEATGLEENDYITKKYYPYQSISGSFAKTNHLISIDFIIEQPLSEVLSILKEYKTSMYIGHATQNELFIDGMTFIK